jgi:hypothetical protein
MIREGGSNDGDAINGRLATVAPVPARLISLTCAVAALAAVAAVSAPATTGIEEVIPVRVTLTDKGVAFSHHLKPNTNSTIAVTVVNRSSARRTFKLGYRKTHQLQRGAHENFYYSFTVPGKVVWRSAATKGKAFQGTIKVKLAGIYGAYG